MIVLNGLYWQECILRRLPLQTAWEIMWSISLLLGFPVPLSLIASFAAKNNLSINVYGVEHGKKVIYQLRVTDAVVPESHVDLLLHGLGGIPHYSMIKNFGRLVSRQLSNHNGATYCCKKCLHAYSPRDLLAAHAMDCCHVQRTQDAGSPAYRSNYRHLLWHMRISSPY